MNSITKLFLCLVHIFVLQTILIVITFPCTLGLQDKRVSKILAIIVVGRHYLFKYIFSSTCTGCVIFYLSEIYSNARVVAIRISLKHCKNVGLLTHLDLKLIVLWLITNYHNNLNRMVKNDHFSQKLFHVH